MAGYDGTGQYTRHFSWQAREAADVGIVSDEHDQEDDEFALAFNKAFVRDGQAAATGDWNLANHKITNLGGAESDNDAVNLAQLTGSGALPTPDIKKALNLIGADANGRINFMSATGVNGIGWFGADLCWVARLDEANKTRDRLVMNNLWNGGLTATPGTDVFILDDAGNVQLTSLTYNLSQDTSNNWRTIAPGYGMKFGWKADGTGMTLMRNDPATVTDPYVLATLRTAMEFNAGTSPSLTLSKKLDTDSVALNLCRETELRWKIFMTGHAESGTFVGSNLYISAFNNDGAGEFTPFYIMRDTGKVGIPYGVAGALTVDGGLFANSLNVIGSNSLLLGGSTIYLRPNGTGSSVGQVQIDTAGHMRCEGYYERSGTSGSYGTQQFNSLYQASNDIRCYVGTSIVGYWTPACDYRVKREIKPLDSCWEKVKALIPVTFKAKAYGNDTITKGPDGKDRVTKSPHKDEETVQMGFLAHQLQEALGEGAATGVRDGEQIQGPNVMHVVAALCAALQEAQLRIEALEAKLA